jgi:hypothetical protein
MLLYPNAVSHLMRLQDCKVYIRINVTITNFNTIKFKEQNFLSRLLTSSPDLSALISRDFKTTSTLKCPDFSMCEISPDDSNGRNRLN